MTAGERRFQGRLEFHEQRDAPPRRRPDAGAIDAAVAALLPRLQLDRDIAAIDLESTGLYPQRDRIVEISVVRFGPSGPTRSLSTLVFPAGPIPAAASAVHGITDEDVAEAPDFAETAPAVRAILAGCDLIGYNLRGFDLPLLRAEFSRIGGEIDLDDARVVDACTIFRRMERRDLGTAHRFYVGEEIEAAHSAEGDVLATLRVLERQIDRYADLSGSVSELDDFCSPPRRDPTVDDETDSTDGSADPDDPVGADESGDTDGPVGTDESGDTDDPVSASR